VITTMPRPRPPHLHREVTRHGKGVWYVRVGRGRRIRIKVEFGTPDFGAEYQAAISGQPRALKGEPLSGTLARLSGDARLARPVPGNAQAARGDHRPGYQDGGRAAFRADHPADDHCRRDRRNSTPAQARHFLETMRGLFRWAARTKMVKDDPTIGVEDPPRPKGCGFQQVAAYEGR
jgi:hypothetical protein